MSTNQSNRPPLNMVFKEAMFRREKETTTPRISEFTDKDNNERKEQHTGHLLKQMNHKIEWCQ